MKYFYENYSHTVFGHAVSGSAVFLNGMFFLGGTGQSRNCALTGSLTCFYWASVQALVLSSTEGLCVFSVFAPGPWGCALPWWGESCSARPGRGREGGCCCPWLQLSCSLDRGWALKLGRYLFKSLSFLLLGQMIISEPQFPHMDNVESIV